MSRTAAREVAVHIVYDYGFNNEIGAESLGHFLSEEFADSISADTDIYSQVGRDQHLYITGIVNGVASKREEIDALITKYSVGWKINRISRIAMAIMRVAVYEIKYIEDVSEKIAINEAVEIAKKYDTAETVSFINGILGSIVREG
ncbi:MAG: transcription antitermination factor NusB [Oscillospiraceae bacterium]|nr:transcription antitermination factor NusB [Oscillospiraceae bacterium]